MRGNGSSFLHSSVLIYSSSGKNAVREARAGRKRRKLPLSARPSSLRAYRRQELLRRSESKGLVSLSSLLIASPSGCMYLREARSAAGIRQLSRPDEGPQRVRERSWCFQRPIASPRCVRSCFAVRLLTQQFSARHEFSIRTFKCERICLCFPCEVKCHLRRMYASPMVCLPPLPSLKNLPEIELAICLARLLSLYLSARRA